MITARHDPSRQRELIVWRSTTLRSPAQPAVRWSRCSTAPRPRSLCRGPQIYADLQPNEHRGLPVIELVTREDQVLAIAYKYHPQYQDTVVYLPRRSMSHRYWLAIIIGSNHTCYRRAA
jgi:hypothetical protein